MTYQQILDEAMGDPPPTSIEINQVVAREGRRGRMRRTGTAGTVAVVVFATAFGIGVLRDGSLAGPAKPAASAQQSSGVATDRQRVTAAIRAAVTREAPGLKGVREASSDPGTWNGAVTTKPEWQVDQFSHLSSSGWVGWAVAARDGIRGSVVVQIGGPKDQPADPLTCSGHSRECTTSKGPDGEQLRSIDFDMWNAAGPGSDKPLAYREVENARPDGTQVSVRAMSATDQFLLTTEQMTAIVLDPALSLR